MIFLFAFENPGIYNKYHVLDTLDHQKLIQIVGSLLKPSRYLYGGVQLRLRFSLISFQYDDLSKLIEHIFCW